MDSTNGLNGYDTFNGLDVTRQDKTRQDRSVALQALQVVAPSTAKEGLTNGQPAREDRERKSKSKGNASNDTTKNDCRTKTEIPLPLPRRRAIKEILKFELVVRPK